MRINSLRSILLPSREYGEIRVAPIPIIDGRWQDLEAIRSTVWGVGIPVVPGSVMAEARHGRVKPLMQVIGRPPHAMMRVVPDPFRLCGQMGTCGSFQKKDCHPCTTLPDCYEPPSLRDPAQMEAARLLALAWRDGVYVVVVDGPEFSL